MKNLLRRALLALCSFSALTSALAVDYLTAPSDPNASQETRNVYDYLRTRRGQSTNRMIEGQFLGMINQVLYPGQSFYGYFDINQHVIDGKLPAIAGSRYDGLDKETNVYRLDPEICSLINLKLIDTWNQAQPIIHVTATPRNPWNQQLGREPDDSTTQKIGKLLRSATLTPAEEIIRANFWADIDTIAGGLQELEDLNIPVLFRPFAEFNQSNKYYFDKQAGADFVALWQEVYHYYVDAAPNGKGLNNLLFCWEVWALNRNAASGANVFDAWYPGENYVDVVAGAFYFKPDTLTVYYIDPVTGAFSFDHSDPEDGPVYNWLISKNRPFGAAQYGLNQGTNIPGDHNFTLAFMDFSPDLAFAAYWNQYQAVERQAHASEFVAEPRVATHDDLPVFAVFPATVTLGNLTHTYDGTPKSATATTAPAGLNVTFTYDGSSTPPSTVGSYTVVGTVEDPNYYGSATDTMTILAAPTTVTFTSLAAEDGWVLESGENSNVGGSFDATASTASALRAGDNNGNRQYKLIVSFDTSSLPTNATILSATLKLKRGTVTGTNPFTTHGTGTVDICTGGFNNGNIALEAADFEAPATSVQVATMSNPVANGNLSTGALDANGRNAINTSGRTQFRVYFTTDDNNEGSADFIGFYSGNHSNPANHPVLEVTYQ